MECCGVDAHGRKYLRSHDGNRSAAVVVVTHRFRLPTAAPFNLIYYLWISQTRHHLTKHFMRDQRYNTTHRIVVMADSLFIATLYSIYTRNEEAYVGVVSLLLRNATSISAGPASFGASSLERSKRTPHHSFSLDTTVRL